MSSRRAPERQAPALWLALERAFHDSTASAWRVVDGVVWALIAASFVLVGVDLSRGPDLPPVSWLVALDRLVLGAFVVELVMRVATFRPPALDLFSGTPSWRLRTHITGRIRFLLTPLMMIDLLAVLAIVPALRGLRALRLLRLVRGVRVFRYSTPLTSLARAFQENALLYAFSFSFLLSIVVVGGMSIFLLERGSNEGISTISDGIWWALVTITTVGFGDITPVTGLGRMVGGVVMVVGMFTLALFAGIVGTTLLRVLLTLREDQFRMASYTNHVVVCGYDPGADLLLEALTAELGENGPPVLVFAPGERPQDLDARFTWVGGDPTREAELDKVHISTARTAIIVGRRSVSPQQADATTLLVLFTIRRYLARQSSKLTRHAPLYLVCEILDPENREHARAAGADEVIETTRLGFALMAHAAAVHGAGVVMSSVVSAGAHSLYIGINPLAGASSFGDVAAALRQSHDVIVIGVGGDDGGEATINPDDAMPVAPGARVVYLAKAPCLEG